MARAFHYIVPLSLVAVQLSGCADSRNKDRGQEAVAFQTANEQGRDSGWSVYQKVEERSKHLSRNQITKELGSGVEMGDGRVEWSFGEHHLETLIVWFDSHGLATSAYWAQSYGVAQ